ncbi:hypothetical protein Q673_02590 [Marinobacter sp. EN3]|uniref:hypothetical protein n=1 Tax=Marinobacter sp. EN3 TaxID=1397533 RepID=UPI0003B80E14|nr:hypothetical protein [Marinobacter sp. EN3]ERS12522.1 hypothetical protein Q673_02590 [Marinobacter sp. EN3]
MIKLRLWKQRQDTPGPVDLRFTQDPGIILELLRPRESTPGPVTLQFGRYVPPEYPTVNGTLSASLPGPALPELTLAANGGAAEPRITGTLQATIPAATIPALTLTAIDQTLRGDLLAALPAPDAPVSLTAGGSQNLDLPDADGVAASMPSRNFQASQTRLATAQQEMERTRTRAEPIQTSALPVTKGHSIRQQQSEKLEASRRLPDQHGQKLDTSNRIGHADAVRIRRAFTSEHQHGIRLTRGSGQPHAETIKLRTTWALAEQQAIPTAGHLTIRANQGAKLTLRLAVRHAQAIDPPPGLATWPPPIDPEPPAEDQITLRFCREQDGSTTLIFGCPDAKPDPGGTIIIPIREIYTVINTVTLTELDGTQVPAESFAASIDADSWTWSWNARIPAAAISQVRPDSSTRIELMATINGEPLRVLVESIQRERRFGESWLRVSGRGRAAFLAEPLAPVTQYTNDTAMTAQQVLNETMTTNGVPIGWSLDWQIEDWQIPAGIWSHNGTWIDAAKRIAEAGGAYVQSHDTDQVLQILPRYPIAPWNWGDATPDIQLPEDVVEVEGIEWQEKPDYNAVWVHGGDQGRLDRIIRDSSGGTNPAPTIVDDLATDAAMTRQRGLALLGDTGKQARISLRLPVLPETGMIRPGTLVEYLEQGTTRRGLVRSLSISHSRPELWQTIGVETHE